MNQKQKWLYSFTTSILATIVAYIVNGSMPLSKIVGSVVLGTIVAYFIFFVVFRYITKNILKWEEIKSDK